ncbi:MAG: glycosyltransferase [Acidimicrobiales bacterium]|jgi:glycosyltransferase involved in cell wall biosynthesis
MWKIAVVGTELAPLRESSGALERVVLAWVAGLERSPQRFEVTRLDADPLTGLPVGRLERSRPDLLILNNRPLWAEGTELPVLHVLHNYQDAWGAGADDQARVRRVLERGQVCAVSAALARHVEEAYRLPRVGEVRVGVEACFFGEQWRGGGGPVLFPNRLLEKKGVRLFLELAAVLDRRCVMFRHLAPWPVPTGEQEILLRLIEASDAVELLGPPATRSEMAEQYATAGVVVCPSIRPEGLGLVALEAQAVGAPLVTSGLGGLAEATFAPNEVVRHLGVDAWRAAVERAAGRRSSGLPRREVERLHGTPVAESSFAEAVLDALGLVPEISR